MIQKGDIIKEVGNKRWHLVERIEGECLIIKVGDKEHRLKTSQLDAWKKK